MAVVFKAVSCEHFKCMHTLTCLCPCMHVCAHTHTCTYLYAHTHEELSIQEGAAIVPTENSAL